jgi:uncharacterized protein (DUF305 family)
MGLADLPGLPGSPDHMTHTSQKRMATMLALVALAGCSASRKTVQTSQSPTVAITGNVAGAANAKADSNRYPFTEADVHFMSGMIHHHAQAIAMSKLAPTHGASSSIQILTARIINAQGDEIRLMQQWLRDHKQEVPEPSPTGMKMKMGGEEHVMLMPGMLSEEQMKQLDAANGKAFDETFLQFMIQHHQGALVMVKELFGTPGAGQDEATFKLANDIQADQQTEIARMQKMLVASKLGVSPQ